MLKYTSIIVAVILLIGFARHAFTRIRFDGVKASISPLYCRWVGYHDTKAVIFIPGIKGSVLTQNGKPTWLTAGQLLHDTPPLTYDENQSMQPAGILTRVTLLPGLITYAPYQRMVATLACNPNAYFFSYDWRRPPMDNVADLVALVERVTKETGQKPSIIGHSMGGLLTHALMKDHSDRVDKVVYVSAPFNPGIGFMTDLNEGSSVGWNKSILSKEAVFSAPSSFALLPHKGNFFYNGQDLMEERTWIDDQLSAFADGNVDMEAFRKTLADTIAFQTKLDTPKIFNNEVLVVNGNCLSIVYASDALLKHTIVQGDGRVAESSSYPVEKTDLNLKTIHSCARHDIQLNDKEIVTEIVKFLR